MTIEEAKKLLALHSCRDEDIDNPKWTNGFMGSLRPFSGTLHEENFTEVMACLNVLKDEFAAPAVDRGIVADIVSMIHLTRVWVSPNGMLGQNHLLTKEQTEQLLLWVDIIEESLMYLLDQDEEDAFFTYNEYLEEQSSLK